MFKNIFQGILEYTIIVLFLIFPVWIILLWFDFCFDLKVDFFSKWYSFSRFLFYIWFVLVTISYIKIKYKDFIDKLF